MARSRLLALPRGDTAGQSGRIRTGNIQDEVPELRR